jgi:hypothetical protein
MATVDPIDDLVSGIDRAAMVPRLWPGALAQLARSVDVRALVLHFDARVARRELRVASSYGLDREFLEAYGARFRHVDPGWSFLESPIVLDVVSRVRLGFRSAGARAFRAEWLAPQQLDPDATLAMVLAGDGDAFTLCAMYRERRARSTDSELARTLQTLAPHLRRAAATTRALVAADVSLEDASELLATAEIPVAVFDSLALLVGANDQLLAFCAGPTTLRLTGDRVEAAGAAAGCLQRAITRACRPRRPETSWAALPRRDGAPPDRALVCPLPGVPEGLEGIGFARAVLLLPGATTVPPRAIAIGDFELDPARFELRRGGEIVKVQPLTLELLLYLASRAGCLVSHAELIEHVWRGTRVSYWAIARAVREARRALGDDGNSQRCIETIHGRGYRLRCSKAAARPPTLFS